MITGRTDTWYTVEEFASMVGREPKTVMNWAGEGKIQFADICGVKLVALSMIENLITGHGPAATPSAEAALRMIGRRGRDGRRTQPERHRRSAGRMTRESAGGLLLSSPPPVGSSLP